MDSTTRARRHLWLRKFAQLGKYLLDELLFPPECAICGSHETLTPFCVDCREALLESAGPACPRCAISIGEVAAGQAAIRGGCGWCRGRSLGFDQALALGPYKGPLRRTCLRLKHSQDAWLGRWATDLLFEARGEALRSFVSGSSARSVVVVPVPLHWRRRYRRGYNQAEELAGRLAWHLSLKLTRPLRRVQSAAPLAGRGRVERTEVMRDAFRTGFGSGMLVGRDVILVDDILTTGATCGAAARALKRAGAGRILAVVLGRADGRA